MTNLITSDTVQRSAAAACQDTDTVAGQPLHPALAGQVCGCDRCPTWRAVLMAEDAYEQAHLAYLAARRRHAEHLLTIAGRRAA